MDERDLEIRNLTYRLFAESGLPPTRAGTAAAADASVDELGAAWRRLHDAHALVLDPASGELLMANPFSAVPTPYRVAAGGRDWYANCAWDALGICAALRSDGSIETTCPDCGEAIGLTVTSERVDDETLVFHCLVPAERWWEDIAFT